MKMISAAIAGFVIQAIGLYAFVIIADSAWASPGKDLVMATTFFSMATLLLFANRPYTVKRAMAISALLAAGYLVAHSLLAITLFAGLLKDIPVPSGRYFQAIAEIFAVLFGLYFLGSAVASLANRAIVWRNRSRESGATQK